MITGLLSHCTPQPNLREKRNETKQVTQETKERIENKVFSEKPRPDTQENPNSCYSKIQTYKRFKRTQSFLFETLVTAFARLSTDSDSFYLDLLYQRLIDPDRQGSSILDSNPRQSFQGCFSLPISVTGFQTQTTTEIGNNASSPCCYTYSTTRPFDIMVD